MTQLMIKFIGCTIAVECSGLDLESRMRKCDYDLEDYDEDYGSNLFHI